MTSTRTLAKALTLAATLTACPAAPAAAATTSYAVTADVRIAMSDGVLLDSDE